MHPVRNYKFYETIELLESHTTKLLDKQCELAKEKMKDIPSDEIGSWDRAVTVADGACKLNSSRLVRKEEKIKREIDRK